MNLNKNQQKLFDKITNNPDTRKRFLIRGDQGVGKTFLLKSLHNYFLNKWKKNIAYLDGRLIGETTQTGFLLLGEQLNINDLSSEIWEEKIQIKNNLQQKYSSFLILIDELGAVSDDFHCYLSGLNGTVENLSIIATILDNNNRQQGAFYSSLESQLTTLILDPEK